MHFVPLCEYNPLAAAFILQLPHRNTRRDETFPELPPDRKNSFSRPRNRIFRTEPGRFSQTLEPSAGRGINPDRSPTVQVTSPHHPMQKLTLIPNDRHGSRTPVSTAPVRVPDRFATGAHVLTPSFTGIINPPIPPQRLLQLPPLLSPLRNITRLHSASSSELARLNS